MSDIFQTTRSFGDSNANRAVRWQAESSNGKNKETDYAFVKRVLAEIPTGKFDVSTRGKIALFYSGDHEKNRREARTMFENNGGSAGSFIYVDETPGGRYLSQIINERKPALPWTHYARPLWVELSRKYARNASGLAIAFVKNSSIKSVFFDTEWGTLTDNKKITNVISNERYVSDPPPGFAPSTRGRTLTSRAQLNRSSNF